MKQTLIDLSNAYIFFCASLYLGLFWSLHFFWFPHFPETLNIGNYHDAIVPQVIAATRFFFITIPIMAVAIVIMLISEWKKKLQWVPIVWLLGYSVNLFIDRVYIANVNDQFIAGVTDPNKLQELLHEWMFLNDLRWVIFTVMWCITMYFFIAKARQKKQIQIP